MDPFDPIYETSVFKCFLHLCFHAVIFIYYFSDRRLLKMENENNSTKNLIAEASYIGLESLEFSL